MITESVLENLEFLARHNEREAARLESLPVAGGDYEAPHSLLANQLSAPEYLRKKAAAYRDAAKEMREMLPWVEAAPEEPSIAWRAVKYTLFSAAAGAIFCGALMVALGILRMVMEANQ